MTVDEAIANADWLDTCGFDTAGEEAAIVLSKEVVRLREENARLNDALGQVYSSSEDS